MARIYPCGILFEPIDAAKPAGDWWVIEAKGVMYGVVKTKLSAGRWNRYGWMTLYYDYGDNAPQPEALRWVAVSSSAAA